MRLLHRIGIDILKVSRIDKILKKHKNRFIDKVFTDNEKEYIKSKDFNSLNVASLFSFKESISKAIGTGFGKSLKFKDIEITYDDLGKPSGSALDYDFSLSASHYGEYVVTMAILESKKIEIPAEVLKVYKKRSDNGHKGTFGKVMAIASSRGMIGSGFLSTTAALRTGSGLVYHYVFKEDGIVDLLSLKHTEVIVREEGIFDNLSDMDAVLFGPGLSTSENKKQVLEKLLKSNINIIIDADGLNMLSNLKSDLHKKNSKVIITPHILEFKRLINKLDITKEELIIEAKTFAKKYDLIVILKDSKTYITDGDREYILDRENSGLATAGSGDVLSGIITSLVGQGYELYDASVLGVNIHSLAGIVSKNKHSKTSMVASDIIASLGSVFKILEGV